MDLQGLSNCNCCRRAINTDTPAASTNRFGSSLISSFTSSFVVQFGAEYFANGGPKAHPKPSAAASVSRPTVLVKGTGKRISSKLEDEGESSALYAEILTVFKTYDRDRNGVLDKKEFKTVVEMFAQNLGLNKSDVRQLMSFADNNGDGMIEYEGRRGHSSGMLQVSGRYALSRRCGRQLLCNNSVL
jgi:hypothetical protein